MTLGYQVFAASSAEKALRVLENGIHLDLILSDIRLPGSLDGIELAREAKARRPDIQVILTSIYDEYLVDHIIRDEFRFIEKPYHLTRLREAIHTTLKEASGSSRPLVSASVKETKRADSRSNYVAATFF
jgi:DNA-binding NtrC family response regulator